MLPASHPDGNGGVALLWHTANATIGAGGSLSASFDSGAVSVGLGRMVVLCDRSSTSHQIR